MHRRIMKAKKGEYVDHINHNPRDNRKSNLRLCTNSENNMNRYLQSNSKTGYKGVSWSIVGNCWRAYIKVRGQQLHLGYFDTKEQAALAYNEAALVHHGAFAILNEVRL